MQINFKPDSDEVPGYCTFKSIHGDGHVVLSMVDYVIVDLNEDTLQVFGYYDIPTIHIWDFTIHFNSLLNKNFELYMTPAGTGLVKIVCNFTGDKK